MQAFWWPAPSFGADSVPNPTLSELRALLRARLRRATLVKAEALEKLGAFELKELIPEVPLNGAVEKEVAALFVKAELPRSLESSLDPDGIHIAAQAALPALVHIISRHGGVVGGWRRFGVLAVFVEPNYDHVKPHFAAALACSLSIQQYAKMVMNPVLIDGGYQPFEFRCGLEVGSAIVSEVGWGSVSEASVYGPIVNRAAKVCMKGPPGELRMRHALRVYIPAAKDGQGDMVVKVDGDEIKVVARDGWLKE